MDDLITRWLRDTSMAIEDLINPTFLTHILTSMGTNMLLHDNIIGASEKRTALTLAKVILILENYDSRNSIGAAYNNRVVTTKVRDLTSGLSSLKGDIIKFYSKRASCTCLKSIHQEARRTIPKMGRCRHCNQEKERVSLSVCSRCMIIQYCSRECQVANWPKHERDCDLYVGAHEEQTPTEDK